MPGPALPYADRAAAGRVLAERLAERDWYRPVVLALPRGGVPVATEVARVLDAPLDVYVIRKIGHPDQPELGVGAIAEHGRPLYDEWLVHTLGSRHTELAQIELRERAELDRRVGTYRAGRSAPEVAGRDVLVIDDGLATGATARAALHALRSADPARLVLAVPVAAVDTVTKLRAEGFDVLVPATPPDFHAVGQWYRRFDQLTDADVVRLLADARGGRQ